MFREISEHIVSEYGTAVVNGEQVRLSQFNLSGHAMHVGSGGKAGEGICRRCGMSIGAVWSSMKADPHHACANANEAIIHNMF